MRPLETVIVSDLVQHHEPPVVRKQGENVRESSAGPLDVLVKTNVAVLVKAEDNCDNTKNLKRMTNSRKIEKNSNFLF